MPDSTEEAAALGQEAEVPAQEATKTDEAAPSVAAVIGLIVALRVLDLVAIGVGGAVMSGRYCPVGCIQEGIANWDAHWYTGIAAFGYSYMPGVDSNVAFFPAFPMLMRWGAPLTGGNYLWSGLAVSLIASMAALLVVARLVTRDFGAAAGRRTTLLLAAAPAGFFFALPYADGLLLLMCAGSILSARRRRWFSAGVLAAGAGTVRVTGILLVIPLLWEFLEQNDWQLRLAVKRRSLGRLALLCLAPLGLASYMLWLYIRFGEPLAFAKAQLDGWPPRTTWLGEPLRYTVVQLMQPRGYLTGPRPDLYWAYLLDAVIIVAAIALAVFARRRHMPSVYLLWWGVALIFPLMSGTTNSFARYALIAFPMFAAGALLVRKRLAFWPVFAVSGAAQLLLARAHGMGWWVG